MDSEQRYRAGYADGSGEEYITLDDKAVLAMRWGCSCCKDISDLKPAELGFRDMVVDALNATAALEARVGELEAAAEASAEHVAELQQALEMYWDAGRRFIYKVETGQARSTVTYNDLRNAAINAAPLLGKERPHG